MSIDGFNDTCNTIADSYMKVESMSAIRFRKTAKGNLPHLSYIFRKPEPLGIEFKTVTCSSTWALLFIEARILKEGRNKIKYHLHLVATASCTKIMIEAKKGIGWRYIKGATKDCFSF